MKLLDFKVDYLQNYVFCDFFLAKIEIVDDMGASPLPNMVLLLKLKKYRYFEYVNVSKTLQIILHCKDKFVL